jgi:hypothetical protein
LIRKAFQYPYLRKLLWFWEFQRESLKVLKGADMYTFFHPESIPVSIPEDSGYIKEGFLPVAAQDL